MMPGEEIRRRNACPQRSQVVSGASVYPFAWNVLLYSEHTWGAWWSIGEPARKETREQWAIKQSYAVAADLRIAQSLGTQCAANQATNPDPGCARACQQEALVPQRTPPPRRSSRP